MLSFLTYAFNEKHELLVSILTLFLSTSVIVLWLLQRSNKLGKTNPCLPPGPRGLPLVGYLPFLGSDLHREFSDLAKVYGPIYKLWFGNKLNIVISSPTLLKEVVRDKDLISANHKASIVANIITFGGNDIFFNPYGEEWKKLRKIFVREMLSNSLLDSLYACRRSVVNKSIRNVYENIGNPIEFGNLVSSTVLELVISMIWGDSEQGDDNIASEFDASKYRKLTAELMVLFGKPDISDIFPIPARFDIQGIERRTKKLGSELESIVDSVIEKRKSFTVVDKDVNKGFLQFLLDLREQKDSKVSITTAQLKALLMDIIVAGTDTTITTIEWLMAELLLHPEIMIKAQQELTQIVGLNNKVEESHLHHLSYLSIVIKETLRLHPPLPLLIPYTPSQNATIGGYEVPKGSKVFLNIWAVHRDPNIWEDPLEFRPQRFLNGYGKFDFFGNNFEFLPFGSGRRICAGIPLAEKSLLYVVSSFLYSFDWELPSGVEIELSDNFEIVIKKKSPILLFQSHGYLICTFTLEIIVV